LKATDPKQFPQVAKEYFNFDIKNNKIKKPEKFAQMLVDSVSRLSGIGWTSGTHTGALVPAYGIGHGTEKIRGHINNTDFMTIILEATGLQKK